MKERDFSIESITVLTGNSNAKIFHKHINRSNTKYKIYFSNFSIINDTNIITDKNSYQYGSYNLEALVVPFNRISANEDISYNEHVTAKFDFTIKSNLSAKKTSNLKPIIWFRSKKNNVPVISLKGKMFSYQTKLVESKLVDMNNLFIETNKKETELPYHEFYMNLAYDEVKVKETIFDYVYNSIIKDIEENKI